MRRHVASSSERGSAIVYIFIGVALFASLIFMFSRSNQNSTQIVTTQQSTIFASDILQYANKLEKTTQKLILNGCSEAEISFKNDIVAGYSEAQSPVDFHCHIFNSAGGNMSFESFSGIVQDFGPLTSPEKIAFTTSAITGVGSTDPDLVFIIMAGISPAVCSAINQKLGVSQVQTGVWTPQWSSTSSALTKFDGTFSATDYGLSANDVGPSYCAYDQDAGYETASGAFVHVLLAR